MRALLLATAASLAALAFSAPAQAQHKSGHGFHSGGQSSVTDVRFGQRDGFRHDRRRHRDRDDDVLFYDYYRDYQGDTAWKSDSFNDWWHDTPSRAYPAWMRRNQDCQRLYWSGGGWRC